MIISREITSHTCTRDRYLAPKQAPLLGSAQARGHWALQDLGRARAMVLFLCFQIPKNWSKSGRCGRTFRGPPPTGRDLHFVISSQFGRFQSDLDDGEFQRLARVLWLSKTLSIVLARHQSQPLSNTNENRKSLLWLDVGDYPQRQESIWNSDLKNSRGVVARQFRA